VHKREAPLSATQYLESLGREEKGKMEGKEKKVTTQFFLLYEPLYKQAPGMANPSSPPPLESSEEKRSKCKDCGVRFNSMHDHLWLDVYLFCLPRRLLPNREGKMRS